MLSLSQGDHVCTVGAPLARSQVVSEQGAYPESRMALEDAQRTVGLVTLHAAEWRIDPHKIGVLGFSAGGHLVAEIRDICGLTIRSLS